MDEASGGKLISGAKAVQANGMLEKAKFVVYDDSKGVKNTVIVQFNPTEYSIQRGTRTTNANQISNDPDVSKLQSVSGDYTTLSISLYYDSYFEVDGTLPSDGRERFPAFDQNKALHPETNVKVNKRLIELLKLIKFDYTEHEAPVVGFVWGQILHFIGKITSHTVSYTMFDRNGTPMRAKVDVTIKGEESEYLKNAAEYPKESPDRTKQRLLRYGDQIWMVAREEYGDVNQWKTIAEANGILNPRAISGVMRLKVPSIR